MEYARQHSRRVLTQAFPTKRYQSTWIGLITHTLPSFVIIGVVLPLVL
jgi:hypothetical protein